MGFHAGCVVEGEVASEGENSAGGSGDHGVDDERKFVLAEVDVDAGDLLAHLQGTGRGPRGSCHGKERERVCDSGWAV